MLLSGTSEMHRQCYVFQPVYDLTSLDYGSVSRRLTCALDTETR